MRQLSLPDEIPGPSFIQDAQDRWSLPDWLTVAQWREAQQATIQGDDKHTLRQFRMATLMLEVADRHGVPEDAILMPTLGFR